MPAGRSRDWISDYVILTNAHNRMGEGDLYLVTKFKNLPVAVEAESATRAFRAQMQRTDQ